MPVHTGRVRATLPAVLLLVLAARRAAPPAETVFTPRCDGYVDAALTMAEGADLDLALLSADGQRLATARRANPDLAAGEMERLSAPVRGGREYRLAVEGGAPGDALRLRVRLARDRRPGPPAASRSRARLLRPLAQARCFHAAAALPDGGAIVAGGTTDAGSPTVALLLALSSTEVFAGGRFRPGPTLSAPRFGPTATALPDGRVLIAGGDIAGTADVFDPLTGALSAAAVPLAAGPRLLHTATLLPDGRVLLAGGVSVSLLPSPGYQTLATTEVFDPKTLAFSPGPALLAPRVSHAAVPLADGRVLVTGGEGRADAEVVDPSPAVFASIPGPDLGGPRDDHSATPLPGGGVLVAGGQGADGTSLDTAEVLGAPADAAFRPLAARLGARRADHEAIPLPSGEVLLLGGEDDPATGPDEILDAVEVFDPSTETFRPMPPLAVPRDDHRAVRLRSGLVLVTGGEDAASLSIPAVEAYDPR